MFVRNLTLHNFRNYEELNLVFDKKINFITGPNGIGKSNIVEAIGLFSHLKSFRQAKDEDLVRFDQDGYYTRIKFDTDDALVQTLQIGYRMAPRREKKLQIEKKRAIITDFMGQFLGVFLVPGDLKLIEGGMGERRRYIDFLLSQSRPEYFKALLEYNRALRHRNALLKRIRENRSRPDELGSWDLQLSDRAEFVKSERLKLVEDLQPIISRYVTKLSGGNDSWQVDYDASWSGPLHDVLSANRHSDVAAGRTTRGPHLDKIGFGTGGRDVVHVASQGQRRTLVLALRMAQYDYLEERKAKKPVVLIDDVITELDQKRRLFFIELLHRTGQAVFTTTSLAGWREFLGDFREEMAVFEIKEPGKIERTE